MCNVDGATPISWCVLGTQTHHGIEAKAKKKTAKKNGMVFHVTFTLHQVKRKYKKKGIRDKERERESVCVHILSQEKKKREPEQDGEKERDREG